MIYHISLPMEPVGRGRRMVDRYATERCGYTIISPQTYRVLCSVALRTQCWKAKGSGAWWSFPLKGDWTIRILRCGTPVLPCWSWSVDSLTASTSLVKPHFVIPAGLVCPVISGTWYPFLRDSTRQETIILVRTHSGIHMEKCIEDLDAL